MAPKRKAASVSADEVSKVAKTNETDGEAKVDDEAEDVQMSEEDALQQREQELWSTRKKELKGTAKEGIWKILEAHGIERTNKDENIDKILKAEAADRKAKRDHEAKVRTAVTEKKQVLEALSLADLAKQCSAAGAKPEPTKQARVECLLKRWLEDDGVNKALAQKAKDERKRALSDMDPAALVKLCKKMHIDPYVTEVMADRVLKCEVDAGHFRRPVIEQNSSVDARESGVKSNDVVAALLASEAARKKQVEQEQREQQEAAEKMKELMAKSKDELEKLVKKGGLEATGKKEDMAVALFREFAAERKVVARKAELLALDKDDLEKLCVKNGHDSSKKVDVMVKAILEYEKQCREKLQAYERAYDKVAEEFIAEKKGELESKSNAELKDMLTSKGLKVGVGKEERLHNLLEEVRKDTREIDRIVAARARSARKAELLSMDKESLRNMCIGMGVDHLVKEIAVERIFDHETEE